jgi:hypothetical protein
MPRKIPLPKFLGALAEPIYEPLGGVLGLDSEQRKARITASWVAKLDLLLDHYEIDRSATNRWELLSIMLALDFVPGMRVEAVLRARRGRKKTWKAGLGDDLVRAVNERLTEKPTPISRVLDDLRMSDPRWKRYPRQTLGARFREAKHAQRRRRQEIAQLLSGDGFMSLANLGKAFSADARMGDILGIGGLAPAPPQQSDEN